jgi:hypothetical protein
MDVKDEASRTAVWVSNCGEGWCRRGEEGGSAGVVSTGEEDSLACCPGVADCCYDCLDGCCPSIEVVYCWF